MRPFKKANIQKNPQPFKTMSEPNKKKTTKDAKLENEI